MCRGRYSGVGEATQEGYILSIQILDSEFLLLSSPEISINPDFRFRIYPFFLHRKSIQILDSEFLLSFFTGDLILIQVLDWEFLLFLFTGNQFLMF